MTLTSDRRRSRTRRFVRAWAAVGTVVAAGILLSPGTAHAASVGCAHRMVQLHGSAAATSFCADKSASTSVTPDVNISFCGSGDLKIYQNGSFSGYEICFSGTGTANMTAYTMPNGVNWNDQASSATTGSNCVVFWSDTNERGNADSVSTFTSWQFWRSYSAVGNDALSSIDVYSC